MATQQPTVVWAPTLNRILAVLAFLSFLLAALAFHGTVSGIEGHTLLAVGLALLSASWIF